jgi:hypothetical protein
MKKAILTLGVMLIGTFALAHVTPSKCETQANAAYDAVINAGGSTATAQAAYNATLSACEKEFAAG